MQNVFKDLLVEMGSDHVATIQIRRPPANFFDVELIRSLVSAYRHVEFERSARAIVLCSEGKHFCAGADFLSVSEASPMGEESTRDLYAAAADLFGNGIPVIAAVQGSAIGGGLGLACTADFRVCSPNSRFAANFSQLGLHQGFGLSVTLPAIVGRQNAMRLLYTGRRISGGEANEIGLADALVQTEPDIRIESNRIAAEIAASGPLAVKSIRKTLRGELPGSIAEVMQRENTEQSWLRKTADFEEGIKANGERRTPRFTGR